MDLYIDTVNKQFGLTRITNRKLAVECRKSHWARKGEILDMVHDYPEDFCQLHMHKGMHTCVDRAREEVVAYLSP